MNDILERLDELKGMGLHRKLRLVSGPQGARILLDGKPVLLLCSNNYLGFADHPWLREAAADAAMRYGVGSGASRLVSGNMSLHRRLEGALANFIGSESCLLFGSGYLANTGVISSLALEGEVVFSDELNHASIIDGCRLSRAETFIYSHRDMDQLEWGLSQAEGRGSLIVTDAIFSMDGDAAPLADIVELAQRYDARVMVDEAHAIGTVGPGGRGLAAELGVMEEIDLIVGTLGKSLGSYGAFVCCDAAMASYLINHARPFIFSTALPPPTVASALTAVMLLIDRPERVERLQRNAMLLKSELLHEGLDIGPSESHIVPLMAGTAARAMELCERALEKGVFAQAIRPPSVPEGSSRLRLATMACHTKSELKWAARKLGEVSRKAGLARVDRPRTLTTPLFDQHDENLPLAA